MASDPSHKPGRCSPKYPEWVGCAVGCKPSNNKLTRQISFIYLVEGDHIGFEGFSGVLLAQEHAQDFPRMRFWTATVPIWRTLPDLACGCPKLRSGDILGMLLCKENSVEASKNYMVP